MAAPITLTFHDLTPNVAQLLLEAYEEASPGGGKMTCAQPVAASAAEQAKPQPTRTPPAQVPATQQQGPDAAESAPPTPAAADLDAEGVPYNPDLHAVRTGPMAGKKSDGTWKAKRHVDHAKVDEWRTRHIGARGAAPVLAGPSPAPHAQVFGAPPQTNGAFGAPAQIQPSQAAPQIQPPQAAPQVQPPQAAGPANVFAAAAPATQPPLEDPGEDALIKLAESMSAAGILVPEETARIMTVAGTQNSTELVREQRYRVVAWRELQTLKARANFAG